MSETVFEKYGWKLLNDLFFNTMYFFDAEEDQRNPVLRLLFPGVCKVRLPDGTLMGTYKQRDFPKVGMAPETERLIEQCKSMSAY